MIPYSRSMTYLTLIVLAVGCATIDSGSVTNKIRTESPKIDKVFFAQYHVLEPSDPLFKLVGGLETLIKVQVYSDLPVPSPHVFAVLTLRDKSREIRLRGPKTLPKRPDGDPALMTHAYDDSFTAFIPKEWVRTGLGVTVELRTYDYTASEDDKDYANPNPRQEVTVLDAKAFEKLAIGAPTTMVLHSFDIHYFGGGKGADYPKGWEAELAAKMPFSELEVRRIRNIVFDEVVLPPGVGQPPKRVANLEELKKVQEEFETKSKRKFSHQIGYLGYLWGAALRRAGSGNELFQSYCINAAGLYSSGRGGRYTANNHLHRRGLIIHELGHAYGLPHWMQNKDYPYKRTMYGRDKGEPAKPNAGPRWAFNMNTREFLPPRAMVDGKLVWIHDPMHGGGKNRHTNSIYTHFSDYSIRRMQTFIETRGVAWNESKGAYAKWDQETGAYDNVVENDGLKLPVQRDVEVVSLIASANATTPEANIIYPPIGPYKAGLVRLFDADSEDDRKAAAALGYTPKTCNVALHVSQGGHVKTYLLRVGIDPKDPEKAFNVTAINLPVTNGKIVKASLIHCPDLMTKGMTKDHRVLAVWPIEK